MAKFKYEVEVPANSQSEADEKAKLALAIVNKFTAEECKRIKEALNNPAKLSLIRNHI